MNPPPNPSPSNRRHSRNHNLAARRLKRRVEALAKQADVDPRSIMQVIGGLGLITTFVQGDLSDEQRKQVFNEARQYERLLEAAQPPATQSPPDAPSGQKPTNDNSQN